MVDTVVEETVFESSIIRVRLNQRRCNPRFYNYWFRSPQGKDAIFRLVTGTNVKGIRGSELKEIRVPVPDREEQNRIADVLKAYDDLIDNSRRQIKLLEEAAQRLYRECSSTCASLVMRMLSLLMACLRGGQNAGFPILLSLGAER